MDGRSSSPRDVLAQFGNDDNLIQSLDVCVSAFYCYVFRGKRSAQNVPSVCLCVAANFYLYVVACRKFIVPRSECCRRRRQCRRRRLLRIHSR